MNSRMDVLFGAYIAIEDGKIQSIKTHPPKEQPKTIIDGTGMVAIPGLINCHTHLATAVLRSLTDDLSAPDALEALLQKEAKMDSRCAKASALLSIAECLRFGVTSVSDLYYYPNATAEAVAESGIKANLGFSTYRFIDQSEDFDFETDEQCQELVKVVDKWNSYNIKLFIKFRTIFNYLFSIIYFTNFMFLFFRNRRYNSNGLYYNSISFIY